MVVNLASKEFRKERKVKETLHFLSRSKKTVLLDAPLADVFDLAFLREAGLGRQEASLRHARDAIALALSALNLQTMRDLKKLSAKDLALLPGLGTKSLAVLLDLLQAFDIELATKPVYKKSLIADGKALAIKLGLTS